MHLESSLSKPIPRFRAVLPSATTPLEWSLELLFYKYYILVPSVSATTTTKSRRRSPASTILRATCWGRAAWTPQSGWWTGPPSSTTQPPTLTITTPDLQVFQTIEAIKIVQGSTASKATKVRNIACFLALKYR